MKAAINALHGNKTLNCVVDGTCESESVVTTIQTISTTQQTKKTTLKPVTAKLGSLSLFNMKYMKPFLNYLLFKNILRSGRKKNCLLLY
jgi:hypothetical protein